MSTTVQPDVGQGAGAQHHPFLLAVLGGVQLCSAFAQLGDAFNAASSHRQTARTGCAAGPLQDDRSPSADAPLQIVGKPPSAFGDPPLWLPPVPSHASAIPHEESPGGPFSSSSQIPGSPTRPARQQPRLQWRSQLSPGPPLPAPYQPSPSSFLICIDRQGARAPPHQVHGPGESTVYREISGDQSAQRTHLDSNRHRRRRHRTRCGASGAAQPAGRGHHAPSSGHGGSLAAAAPPDGPGGQGLRHPHREPSSNASQQQPGWLQAATVAAGATSRTLAQVAIHPLDTLKTRLQVRLPTPQLQVWRAVMSSPATRPRALMAWVGPAGMRDMFLGLGAAVAGTLPASALYFTAEQTARGWLAGALAVDRDAASCRLVASAAAATLSALVRVPADVVKHRVQAYAYPSVSKAAGSILAARGPAGLYAGFGATLLRDAPEMVVQFTVYGQLKAMLESSRRPARSHTPPPLPPPHPADLPPMNRNPQPPRRHDAEPPRTVTPRPRAPAGCAPLENLAVGGAAGAVAALVTTPLDVVKTQLQCGAASSVGAALSQALRTGGPGALFGGVGPRVVQTALCSAIFFTCFEASKAHLAAASAVATAAPGSGRAAAGGGGSGCSPLVGSSAPRGRAPPVLGLSAAAGTPGLGAWLLCRPARQAPKPSGGPAQHGRPPPVSQPHPQQLQLQGAQSHPQPQPQPQQALPEGGTLLRTRSTGYCCSGGGGDGEEVIPPVSGGGPLGPVVAYAYAYAGASVPLGSGVRMVVVA